MKRKIWNWLTGSGRQKGEQAQGTGILLLGGLVLAFILGGCGRAQPGRVKHVDTAMGTVIRQDLYVCGETDYCGDILRLLGELEGAELSWRLETSQVYRINHATGDAARERRIPVTEEMAGILGQCLELTRKSNGAFDVTLGEVVRLWDIDSYAAGTKVEPGDFRVPGEQELQEALSRCGSHRMRLESDTGNTGIAEDTGNTGNPSLYMPEGMQLDLGAVGKGIALDRIREYLQGQPGVTGAVVSVGGSILTYGEKPDNSSFRIGILDPAEPSRNIGILTLDGEWCISTSGDYERYVEVEGVRYHHILDPATGYPADSGVRSVTVLSQDGLLSDGLSTACFILGEEKGMALAKEYGVHVLFVLEDGRILMSPGMETFFQLLSG